MKNILVNSSWLLIDKIARLILGMIASIAIARHLGPESYGILAFSLTMVAIFQAASKLGMDGIIVRDLAKDYYQPGELMATTFALRLVSGLLMLGIMVGVLFLAGDKQSALLALIAGTSLIFQPFETIDLWFQSRSENRNVVIVKLFTYFSSFMVKIWMININASLALFALASGIEFVFLSIGLVFIYFHKKIVFNHVYNKIIAKKIMSESWPLMLSGIAIMIYMRIDQVMIKYFLGDVKLGVYSAVVPLSSSWAFIPSTLLVALAPFISKVKVESDYRYYRVLEYIFLCFSISGWSIVAVVYLSSEYAIPILFGDEYYSGSDFLKIHVFTNVLISMGLAQTLWIINEGKSIVSLYKTMSGVIVCISLNYLLIPIMELEGAAWSSVISQLVSCVLINIFLSRRIFILQVKSLLIVPGIYAIWLRRHHN